MYISTTTVQHEVEDFQIREGFQLDENNRWVILSKLIPWSEFEREYANLFDEKMGAPAKSFRLALGSLLIQQILNIRDRETVAQIKENPYLQYFLGFNCYEYKAPFNSSMLVYFRQRIKREVVDKINREIVKQTLETKEEKNSETGTEEEREQNKGKLILDATVTPSDIKYPTDLGLLNHGRQILNKLIDKLYKPLKGKLEKKPRTDRKEARRNYLKVAKKRCDPAGGQRAPGSAPRQKRVTEKEKRKAIKKQLRYVERNLGYIEYLKERGSSIDLLTKKEQQKLETIKKLYEQQQWMYENNKRSIEKRIVSIEQSYIRPIVRGKARQSVEFGAKISISYLNGYVFLDEISWSNFNESQYLIEQVEKYKEYTGHYPKSIHVDKIYRTKTNRKYCQEKGIRMSGPPLGRPKKKVSNEEKKQAREDERIRNRIEGKFGEGKRRYGLDLIKTKLKETSENKIAMTILAMNLMTLVRRVIKALFCLFLQKQLNRTIIDNFYLCLGRADKTLTYE